MRITELNLFSENLILFKDIFSVDVQKIFNHFAEKGDFPKRKSIKANFIEALISNKTVNKIYINQIFEKQILFSLTQFRQILKDYGSIRFVINKFVHISVFRDLEPKNTKEFLIDIYTNNSKFVYELSGSLRKYIRKINVKIEKQVRISLKKFVFPIKYKIRELIINNSRCYLEPVLKMTKNLEYFRYFKK